MWAWSTRATGSAAEDNSLLHKVQVPFPVLASPQHIIVQVHAAGVNPVDIHKSKAIQPPKTLIRNI